ncbi:MAG: hypothetical protein ABIO62_15580 [Paracoccaceae bacterium]
MATRLADGRNPDKTKLQAQSSKEKVAIAKANEMAEWQKKMRREGREIDRALDDLIKQRKKVEEAIKNEKDKRKAVNDGVKTILKGFQEKLEAVQKKMKPFQSIAPEKSLPKVPMDALNAEVLLVALADYLIYWKFVQSKVK